MKHGLLLIALLAVGGAGAQTPEPSPSPNFYVVNTDEWEPFWKTPECPEGWGEVIVKMPAHYDYETVTIECGLVVEEGDD